MYRREFFILIAFALLAMGVVAGCTTLLAHRLKVAVNEVAEVTVPDFLNIGQLNSRLLENWAKVLLIQQTNLANDRLSLIEEIKANSVDAQIAAFKKAPNLPEQQMYLDELIIARSKYLIIREQYFRLVTNGNMAESRHSLSQELMPAFNLYRGATNKLYNSTALIGKARAQHVVEVAQTVIIGAAFLSVLVFVAGFFTGFHTLFKGLPWVNNLAHRNVVAPQN